MLNDNLSVEHEFPVDDLEMQRTSASSLPALACRHLSRVTLLYESGITEVVW
jgi:hypothetical protein